MKTLYWALLLLLLTLANAHAQPTPLQFLQQATPYNLQSERGVPISSVTNAPPGSDGRAPDPLTGLVGHTNQFQGMTPFSGVTSGTLPSGGSGSNQIVLSRARLGNVAVARSFSLYFGEVILPPSKDEYGVDLAVTNLAVTPPRPPASASAYWLAEPYTTTGHVEGGYYWSLHAENVYATQPGQVEIIWRKAAPSVPSGSPPDVGTIEVSGATYTLYTNRYLVSSLPIKPPRRIYWTEGPLAQIGKPILVPTERVQDINIVYNDRFPKQSSEFRFDGQLAGPIEITNTLWFDRTLNYIRAYNLEGRVFVELLGDKRGSFGGMDIHQQLGIELVEVFQRPVPADVTIELGERLTPFQGGSPAGTPDLFPDPVLTLGPSFAFPHSVAGTERFDYFAIRETQNQTDYQVHWMEEGLQGLFWPWRFVRYRMVWPDDVARYTHYVRPEVATVEEARKTAVPLPPGNAPQIAYQDPLDQPRGKLTENFAYYSFLEPTFPAHRALLQFTAGEHVRFERVFSWLDSELRRTRANPELAVFHTDFTSVPEGGNVWPTHTYVADGVLHLTDAGEQQIGLFEVEDFTGGRAVRNFRATFKVSMRDPSITPGDGFSFSFGPFGFSPGLEDGAENGLAVSFDAYDQGALDEAPSITIRTNNVRLAGVSIHGINAFPDPDLAPIPTDPATGEPLSFQTGETFVPVDILLREDGTMDVSFKGVKVLNRIATGYVPTNGLFILAARTSSRYQTHWIDDLAIVVNRDLDALVPFAGSVATDLTAWLQDSLLHWPDPAVRPRIEERTVLVGERITALDGEIGGGLDTNYLAGYIQSSQGDHYHPTAYLDPFVSGFDLANQGAILPVNAVPGEDLIEVWWFRRNQVDIAHGFSPVLWPAVIGRYTIEWPTGGSEIVLASNDGSGPLPSLEATGSIYYQNDPGLPGYNPNEEHALMQGGQVFALRDDLNILTNDEGGYSSHPLVLLEYTASDGRPAIRTFKVMREKPEAGMVFEYDRPAGSILQPPMPLPLLGPAFAPKIPGQPLLSLSSEIPPGSIRVDSSDADEGDGISWTLVTEEIHGFRAFWPLALGNAFTPNSKPFWFYGTQTGPAMLQGVISTNYPASLLEVAVVQTTDLNRWRFGYDAGAELPLGPALLAVPGVETGWQVQIVVRTVDYVEVDFGTSRPGAATTNAVEAVLVPSIADIADGAFDQGSLAWNDMPRSVSNPGVEFRYANATLADRKGNIWVYRGPHLPGRPEGFSMRFYYKTLPGFHFPSQALEHQPPAGTVTPYLRAYDDATGLYVGDPIFGNADNNQEADGQALPITYHPVWPDNVPVLQMAESLTTPKRGLPAVRGQSSLEVLYQQSHVQLQADHTLALDTDLSSVLLHDPTREKTVEFDLNDLPGSIRTEISNGKTYFPNLPPHMVERFWLDPNRGSNGALVFAGDFVEASLGDSYLLLNVAGANDMAVLQNLCDSIDPRHANWVQSIAQLKTEMAIFEESTAVPGTYIPTPPYSIPLGEPAAVIDDDVAVDSYALTAIGPNTGYVSLIAGNGLAFTPEAEPVSVHVLRVSPTLYRGEVAVIESDNPLNEKLTLQQVVDLAGRPERYAFDWRIAAPVDGQPPSIFDKQVLSAFTLEPWSHVRHPLPSDTIAVIENTPSSRVAQDVVDRVAPISQIPFESVGHKDGHLRFVLPAGQPRRLAQGNAVVLSLFDGSQVPALVHDVPADDPRAVLATLTAPGQVDPGQVFRLYEQERNDGPESLLFTHFDVPPDANLTEVWLSLERAEGLGVRIYLDGGLIATSGLGTDDTPLQNPPADLATPRLGRAFRLPASVLAGGEVPSNGAVTHRLAVEVFSSANPDVLLPFQVRMEAFEALDQVLAQGSVWLALDPAQYEDGVRAIVGGTADVRSLSDNYLTMRYRPISDTNGWSQWTEPQLAEGWIKRVLKGINPFNQRITDLFNNSVNTDVSLLTQAGQRWEGDIALSLASINDYGLIEIYETVLHRGRNLSLGGGINYGPANDALLLAAGYLNDLYMMLGNEAASDAANPTIGIGTADNTYGDIATALFSFKGQLPSVLEEELALFRGRDDFLVPGVETRPVYNRMVWNYTRGIDAGEVIYALNYNILDQNTDGVVDAEDARHLYPQGHGDAYGHYLTALKGYYHLLLDPNFDWVPRSEAVLVLGKPVTVDYQDERKFAAAAGALARTGKQIFDLTWRKDYKAGTGNGWSHYRAVRESNKRTRYWGMDHWAARTGQGAYLNWIVGNAILPEVDPDPAHRDTIQQVDRSTVPELKELPMLAESLQVAMDNAESGLTPLGLPEDTVPFDLNPNVVVSADNQTHFEQVYGRAKAALNNALVAFDDAKDVTRLMRSEEDSLADLTAAVDQQELAYTNALIELFGTPYPEDIGPGRTYRTGYAGPDLIHFSYIDKVELNFNGLLDPVEDVTWRIDTQTFTNSWINGTNGVSDFNWIQPAFSLPIDGGTHTEGWETNHTLWVEYNLSAHGYFEKPDSWTGRRASPGNLQQAISDIVKARNAAFTAFYWADAAKYDLDWAIQSLEWKKQSHQDIRDFHTAQLALDQAQEAAKLAFEIYDVVSDSKKLSIESAHRAILTGIPTSYIAGLAAGGDLTSGARAAILATVNGASLVLDVEKVVRFSVLRGLEYGNQLQKALVEFNEIVPEQWNQELRDATSQIRDAVYGMNNHFMTINARLQELDDAQRRYRALLAEGQRLQQERQIFRERTAAIIQGYRTRDAAFRIFRNEKLERYKTLFDLAAQYAFMAAKAYDYETGLLGTPRGREFLQRIVNARALGVVEDGEPQFAGGNTGDPGISSVLAEMHADWSVVKGRLGFNNPDAYGTTASLRYENYRITTNEVVWKNVLNQARRDNLLDDPDVRRYCLQLDNGSGLPVPGLILEFTTTIADGQNLFGRPSAPGDHHFSASSFATKIFATGVALEGYIGMDDPAANAGAVNESGGSSPEDPDFSYLDPDALTATPYIYLVPVGVDSMRSPPLGDTSDVRTWNVQDVAIPLPFNIGVSDFSTTRLWQSQDSLSEQPFAIRKHQAFRPVSSASLFDPSIYTSTGGLQRSQFTNNRLVGRSVWNSKWKIVIPGRELLANPQEGMERFIRTVSDVKLHFVTYSYSGN